MTTEQNDQVVAPQDNTNTGVQDQGIQQTTDGETKTVENSEEPKALLGGKEAGKEELESAPETYEKFVLPEGVEIEESVLGEYSTLAKELNLSQANAQKLIDLANKNVEGLLAKQDDSWKAIQEKWVNDIKSDSQFGGAQFKETLERANRTVRNYGSPELISFFNETGYGNNPELVKTFARIDKALGEDKVDQGNEPKLKPERSAAEVLYGNTNKN